MKGQNTFRGPWPAFQTGEGEAVVVGEGGQEAVMGVSLDEHLDMLRARQDRANALCERLSGENGTLTVDGAVVPVRVRRVSFSGPYKGEIGYRIDAYSTGEPIEAVEIVGPTEAELDQLAASVLAVEPQAPAGNVVVSDTGAARSNDTADVRYDLITPIGLEAVAAIYTGTEFCADPPEVWLAEALDDAYAFLGGEGDEFLAGAVVGVLEAIQALSGKDRQGRLEATGQSFEHSTVYRYDLIPPAGLTEVAKRYAIGAKKYEKTRGPFNWERGLDANDIINHGIRHIRNYLAGDLDDEDALLNHLGAAAWNFMAAIHSLKLWPSLNAGKFRRRGCRLPEGLLTPEQETKLYGDAA